MNSYDVIARFYDLEHRDYVEDVQFYLGYVQEGPVLEIGAGTGRVTAPLVQAGFEVWGIDSSAQMLALAERRLHGDERFHPVRGDLLSLDLSTRFATALMPLNTLWHMTAQNEQIRALRVVHRHMKRGGLLILDLSNPLTMADRGAAGEVHQRFHRRADETDVWGWSASWDDSAEQTLTLDLVYDEVGGDGRVCRSSVDLELRYVYRAELGLLLQLAGFTALHEYGSYDLEPYGSSSPNLLVVARAD